MSDWGIFWVTFKLPKFGTDGKEFDEREWHMGVSTQGGKKDAEAACKQYHKGCKVVCVLTQIEEECGARQAIEKSKSAAPSKKKKGK